jgi:hypothetical protein
VIDGVQVENGLSAISPDIRNIDVLKCGWYSDIWGKGCKWCYYNYN